MSYYLSPIGNDQFVDSSGAPLSGALLFTYTAGSSTKATVYKDNDGNTAHSNPIVLNSSGRAASPIWLPGGATYKLVLAPSNDTDPPASAIFTWDDVSGVNDPYVAVDEWVTGPTPTYVSATSFTLSGDQTSVFQVGRRVKATVTAGTVYGTITSTTYSSSTTVVIVTDSGSLDSGLSAIYYGLLSADNKSYPDGLKRNFLVNGDFRVAQRGTTFTSATTPANNDDTFLLDRWILLADGNDTVDVSQETTTVPTGSYAAIKLDVETANRKFGILQPLEARDAASLIGGTATLQFKARKGGSNATAETLRAAIISWSSTADSITSDAVSAWGNAGTDPTLATNWTYETTPSNLTLTTSYQTFVIAGSIDTASTTNVAVFIWCDDTDATVADLIYIADVRLVSGYDARNVYIPSFTEQMAQCERYYEKSFAYGTVPAQNVGINTGETVFCALAAATATRIHVQLRTLKRSSPTVTLYNPQAANAEVRDQTAAADCSGTGTSNTTDRAIHIATASNAGSAVGNRLGIHWTADAEL